jgi:hypothetical protein
MAPRAINTGQVAINAALITRAGNLPGHPAVLPISISEMWTARELAHAT